jgi:hypoxanthine phosphoribosyltransferase
MPAIRREALTWDEVGKLIDTLVPQFESEFEAMVLITRGGIVPGGLLAEALSIQTILTAAVDFPAEIERQRSGLFAWPRFFQFPEEGLLLGKRCLVMDDVWGSGRTITAVKNRISAAGGFPSTCVLHFNPQRNLFGAVRPDYYAAVTDAYIVYPWEIDRGPERVRYG